MPVEIRELQIVTVVKEAGTQAVAPSGTKDGNAGQDKIVQACVEQVLEILKEKNER